MKTVQELEASEIWLSGEVEILARKLAKLEKYLIETETISEDWEVEIEQKGDSK